MNGAAPVFLLTDFGDRDVYAGVLKAVMLRLAPGLRLVDLAHGIPPGDLRAGAWQLAAAWPYLPEPAVVLAVVDPGVGTERRALALAFGDRVLVAPDNGLAHFLLETEGPVRVHALENEAAFLPEVSATFHGRDLFAPVAAGLAAGAAIETFGPEVEPDSLVRLDIRAPIEDGETLRVPVLVADRFGNLGLHLERAALEAWKGGGTCHAETRAGPAPLVRTFADVPSGSPCLLVGSAGRLELACRDRPADRELDLHPGDSVVLRRSSEEGGR